MSTAAQIERLMVDLAEEKQAIWKAQVRHVKTWCEEHGIEDDDQLHLLEGLRAAFRAQPEPKPPG